MLMPVEEKYKHMIDDMYIRGVSLKGIKNDQRPFDIPILSFHREMFMYKLGLKTPKITDSSETYITLEDAHKIYNEVTQ